MTYPSRPKNTVIAVVCDPNASAKAFDYLARGHCSTLITVKIDSSPQLDPHNAVKVLHTKHSITSLDVIVTNPEIHNLKGLSLVASLNMEAFKEHVGINTTGPLALFQSVLALLQKLTEPGQSVTVNSPIGSSGGMGPDTAPMAAYGASKAALNCLTCKIHFEDGSLISFPINAG